MLHKGYHVHLLVVLIPQDSATSRLQPENNQTNKTVWRYCLKREVGGSSAVLWAFIASPWQTPTQSCSWLWDSQLVPTHPNLSVVSSSTWVQKGNWSSKHAERRGKRGRDPRMDMNTVGWWYKKHRGLWRSKGQDTKVMDWRIPKPRYHSHSLPHIAHVNHVTKLGV